MPFLTSRNENLLLFSTLIPLTRSEGVKISFELIGMNYGKKLEMTYVVLAKPCSF